MRYINSRFTYLLTYLLPYLPADATLADRLAENAIFIPILTPSHTHTKSCGNSHRILIPTEPANRLGTPQAVSIPKFKVGHVT